MKFKFAPKGDYKLGQPIFIGGVEYTVETMELTGRQLTATTPFRGYKNMPKFERIVVILTDEPPIVEIKPPPGYTADELDRDNPYNQWMEEA